MKYMTEHIEKQAVMDKFAEVVAPSNHSDFQKAPTWNDAVNIVENFPPADVRPVVRGRWEVSDDSCWHICSECGAEIDASVGLLCYVGDYEVRQHNFCPNCGADMRGGDADGDEKD